MSNREETEKKIVGWLTEEGYVIKKMEDPKTHYHYSVQAPGGFGLDIVHPMGAPDDKILVLSGVRIDGPHLLYIKGLSTHDRQKLIYSVMLLVNNAGADYGMVDATGRPDVKNPTNIQVSKGVWSDGMNKNVFMTTIENVRRAALSIILTFNKEAGVVPPAVDPSVS
jgi:hypothetical protein